MHYIHEACCEAAAEIVAKRLKDHKIEADVGPVIFGEHMITVSARVVPSRQELMDAIGPAVFALMSPISPKAVGVDEAIDDHATVSVVLEVETAEALRHLRAGVDSALDDLTPKGEDPPSKEEIAVWRAGIWKVRNFLHEHCFTVDSYTGTFGPDASGLVSRVAWVKASKRAHSGEAQALLDLISQHRGVTVHRACLDGEALRVELRLDLRDEQLGEPIRAAAKRGES